MSFKNQRTPLLGEGLAQSAMEQFLTIIKSHRGLTSYIERNGVNGQWLKPDEPYDIRFTKLCKILEKSANYRQSDETFMENWNNMGLLFLKIVKK